MTIEAPSTKRCKDCDQTKPLDDFYPNPTGTPRPYCRTCDNLRNTASRNKSENLVATRRARQRATAELLVRHAAEFKSLFDAIKPIVVAELRELGGPEVRLKPGQRLEGQDVQDRIADLCDHCSGHHQRGHTCETCGSAPGQATPIIHVSRGEPVRFPRGSRVVLDAGINE